MDEKNLIGDYELLPESSWVDSGEWSKPLCDADSVPINRKGEKVSADKIPYSDFYLPMYKKGQIGMSGQAICGFKTKSGRVCQSSDLTFAGRCHRHTYRVGLRRQLDGATICGANGSMGWCQSTSIAQNGRCRFHGGGAPSGELSPLYKTGRYITSKTDPRIQDALIKLAMSDDESYLEQRQEIELLTAMNQLLLSDFNLEDAGEFISTVKGMVSTIRTEAIPIKRSAQIEKLIEFVSDSDTNWSFGEIRANIATASRVREAEMKLKKERGSWVRYTDVVGTFKEMIAIVYEEVGDEQVLRRIQKRISLMRNRFPM